jgi:predicted DNA-binding protein
MPQVGLDLPYDERKFMSVVARLPEDLYENIKKISALEGRPPGEVLRDAWEQYLTTNREGLAAQFETAAELLRKGDTQGLATMASASVEARAEMAAEAARSQ